MTDESGIRSPVRATAKGLRRGRRRLFGDRVGETIFLGALVLFGLTWKVAPVVQDAATAGNALVAVADGHLHVETFVYGSESESGLHVVEGHRYAGNYGHVVLSVPFLWMLAVVSAVVDPGVVLFTGWSVVLVAFAVALGDLLDRRRTGLRVGIVVAVAALAGNVAVSRPMGQEWLPLVALQLSTMVAAALLATTTYRLVRRATDRIVGTASGAAIVLASPVAFWATVPAAHTVTALLVVATLYAFLRAREADDQGATTRFRALAYACAGLTTWIDAPVGLVSLAALLVVDAIATWEIGLRPAGIACTGLLLSIVPALLTNLLITGNPVVTPAMGPAGPVDGAPTWIGTTLASVGTVAGAAVGTLLQGGAALADPGRLYEVFVRSEFSTTEAVPLRFGPVGLDLSGVPINLSVVESMPLLGALVAAPAVLYRSWTNDDLGWPRVRHDPERATDALAVLFLALLVLVRLPQVPAPDGITVRHLHPLFPVGVYLLARFEFVRETVRREWRLLAGNYAVFVVAGIPAFVLLAAAVTVIPAQVARINAMLGIVAAGVVLYWGLLSALDDGYERLGATALAFAGAVTTAFLLLATVSYFPVGDRFALPLVRLIARSVPL